MGPKSIGSMKLGWRVFCSAKVVVSSMSVVTNGFCDATTRETFPAAGVVSEVRRGDSDGVIPGLAVS